MCCMRLIEAKSVYSPELHLILLITAYSLRDFSSRLECRDLRYPGLSPSCVIDPRLSVLQVSCHPDHF